VEIAFRANGFVLAADASAGLVGSPARIAVRTSTTFGSGSPASTGAVAIA